MYNYILNINKTEEEFDLMDKSQKLIEKVLKEKLLFVERPARYTGNEFGVPKKNFTKSRLRFALVFPEIYEIGMSNIAIKLLYTAINREDELSAERVFHPWPDFEQILINNNVPLFSLETKTPVKDFGIVGFSIPYEILITNVLNILKLSDIPVKRENRNENHPIIICSGNGVANALPYLPFFDVFVFGEADTAIVEISKICLQVDNKLNKLEALSEIDGVFVPGITKKVVNHRIEPDLDKLDAVYDFPVPSIQVVQDRVAIEISRGCSSGCRFCQAGFIYRPVRERSVEKIFSAARTMIEKTGCDEITLISLSASDYSQLNELLTKMDSFFSPQNVNVALPSMRVDSFTNEIAIKMSRVRKSGLTFAIEAGSESLRCYINKNISEEQVFSVVSYAVSKGWNLLKFYFMIGFGQGEEVFIKELIEKIINKYKKLKLNVNIGTFVPKPMTPFELNEQLTKEKARDKIDFLINALAKKYKNVRIKYQDPEISEIEGFLSRAGENFSNVLVYLHENGAKLDAWSEFFNYELWIKALKNFGISRESLLASRDNAPWHKYHKTVDEKFLRQDFDSAENLKPTPDCRRSCTYCGICNEKIKHKYAKPDSMEIEYGENQESLDMHYLVAQFEKTDIFTGHRDLMNVFTRSVKRSGINAVFTRGFNPRPRLQLPGTLPLGFASECEYLILKVYQDQKDNTIIHALNNALPPGIYIKRVMFTTKKIKGAQQTINHSVYRIENVFDISKIKLFAQGEMIVNKNGKEISLKDVLKISRYFSNGFEFELIHDAGADTRALLDTVYGDWRNFKITRTGLFVMSGEKIIDFFDYIENLK